MITDPVVVDVNFHTFLLCGGCGRRGSAFPEFAQDHTLAGV